MEMYYSLMEICSASKPMYKLKHGDRDYMSSQTMHSEDTNVDLYSNSVDIVCNIVLMFISRI